MNNETKFLGYNGNLCEFVVMEVVGCNGNKPVIDTGDGNHDIEFHIWDLLKAMRRYQRSVRQEKRATRNYNRKVKRENP